MVVTAGWDDSMIQSIQPCVCDADSLILGDRIYLAIAAIDCRSAAERLYPTAM